MGRLRRIRRKRVMGELKDSAIDEEEEEETGDEGP